ncbi:hypothetical protein F2Q68_00030337 [Brassica cretica]|uniref:MATE efflux family protein n=1 Tax=Brassica cretica TaxID=69181 RepID=A0A8S9G8B6_BRACR|nr:hypothetical protein F2Q68_00030337 [Brassica cretica]
MEEPILLREELVPVKTTWQRGQLTDELKKVGRLAAPMATVTIAQYLLPVISVMIAGHKGELQLSGVALATSFTNFSEWGWPASSILAGCFFRKWDLWVRVERNRWSMSRAKDVWKLVKTNLSLMKDTECRLSDFSMGRQGKHQVGSVNKSNMLEVVRDGARYVNLSDGYHAVTKQLPKQIQDGSVWLLNYLTDWDGLWDWNCQVVKKNRQLPFLVGFPRIRKGEAILDRNRENRERKGETDGEGLRSARSTDRILSPTTLEFSGGLTDRLRCVGFWFEDTKQVVNRKNRSVFGHGS